jgi:hypothetical protein
VLTASLQIHFNKGETHMGMIGPLPKWTGNEMTGRIRATVRERLAEYFAEFLNGVPGLPLDSAATPEEQRFILDVFETWENNRQPGRRDGEVYIATAFELMLAREEPCVVHVSEGLADNVKAYIRWLNDGGLEE